MGDVEDITGVERDLSVELFGLPEGLLGLAALLDFPLQFGRALPHAPFQAVLRGLHGGIALFELGQHLVEVADELANFVIVLPGDARREVRLARGHAAGHVGQRQNGPRNQPLQPHRNQQRHQRRRDQEQAGNGGILADPGVEDVKVGLDANVAGEFAFITHGLLKEE